MAQHDYNIANQTGANFRADLNNALSAIVSNNSGSSEPSTMYAYEWWIDTSNNVLKLRNSANNAWITMPFSITADNTVDITAGTVNGITSLSFSSGATVTSILDEDNLGSDSATALATQQSIKAYVDSQVTAQDLDISDGSSTIAIDLDSETLSLLGGTGVTSAASGNGVTFSIGQSVGTSDNVVFNQVTGALVGNASTATALATARTISGVSFDGTANITLDTDDISEGSSNLYYTNARVDSRFDTRLATKTTDNLTEGTTNKYFTAERVDDQVNTLLTAGANISLTYDDAAGTLTIANTNSADITSVVAGDGLTGGGTSGDVTLAVGVDDSSIEISSDALRVKATGITNAMLSGSIANAKLANSSITVNSQAIALGGSHTFDTDDIGEGSSNLYYTDARANSAIDTRVTNTFINNLSGVVADTATALATGRTIALSGDVTASGVSFDGTGNITLSTTIAADSVALGTDTTGNYVSTIAGTTNEIEVSGSGSETATVTIGLPDDVTIAGNLTVNGTTTTVNSDTLSVTDPLIKLAKSNSGADSLDIGFYGLYDTSGSQDLYAGLFRDANDSGKFKLFKDLQVEPTTTVNTSGTGYAVGTLVSNLEGNVTGNVTGTVSSISNHSTSDLSEGTNLYYTDARFDTRLGTKTTDNLTEGSSNLYMTTERVQDIVGGMVTGNTETGITVTYDDSDGTLDFVVGTLNQDTTGNAATATALETARTIGGVSFDGTGNIDLAGVNTTGNQDTSGNAATATALATGRTIGMTGDVVWTSASFDGSGNVTGTATIQPNSVALSTDTTGDYVSTITAGTGLTSTGATSGEGIAHTLSVDAAQTQITSVGTLTSLTVDDITLDGSTISDGGDLLLDIGGNLQIDADDNGEVRFLDGGTQYAAIKKDGNNALFQSIVADGDFKIEGIDGSSFITALTLDMSDAGTAIFNAGANFADTTTITATNAGNDITALQVRNNDSSTSTSTSIRFVNSTSGTSTAGGGEISAVRNANDGGALTFKTAADTTATLTERMRIDSAGTIYQGTTTPTLHSASRGIVFENGSLLNDVTRGAGKAINLAQNCAVDSGNTFAHLFEDEASNFQQFGGEFFFFSAPSGAAGTDCSFTQVGKITTSGQYQAVSGAVSAPSFSFSNDSNTGMTRPTGDTLTFVTGGSERVRINSDGSVVVNNSGGDAQIYLGGTSGTSRMYLARSGADSLLWNVSNGAIKFGTNNFERMRIDNSGQLLYDCTSNSQSSDDGIKFVSNGRIFSVSSYSTSAQESLSMYSTGASAFRFYVDWGGTIHATSTSISAISDQRLKENIVDLETGLTEVMALKPRRFDWKNGNKTQVAGFIAQEVEAVLPDLIDGFKDDTIEDAKGVRMGDMIPTLVKAIQEQQEQIEALQSEINILKGE